MSDRHSVHDLSVAGASDELRQLISELYPICRSITARCRQRSRAQRRACEANHEPRLRGEGGSPQHRRRAPCQEAGGRLSTCTDRSQTTFESSGTSSVSTALVPMKTRSPTRMPPMRRAPAPMTTSLPTTGI